MHKSESFSLTMTFRICSTDLTKTHFRC